MGTHISRVKSVDLDSWTDEQVANMLRWGNRRANRYWEFKLNQKDGDGGGIGHVPREEKIENFIRTKYESKRWVMDGPMPDPETLGGEEDDDVVCIDLYDLLHLSPKAVVSLIKLLTKGISSH